MRTPALFATALAVTLSAVPLPADAATSAARQPMSLTSYTGDFDGDGALGSAVRRGATYTITDGALRATVTYGRAGDGVVIGDFDGDGRDTISVRRGTMFFINNALAGGQAQATFPYGRLGDEVLVGDFDGDGKDELALRRGATFHIKRSLSGGPADRVLTYGRPGDRVVVGDFDGDGRDSVAVVRDQQLHVKNSLAGGAADVVRDFPADAVVEGTTIVRPGTAPQPIMPVSSPPAPPAAAPKPETPARPGRPSAGSPVETPTVPAVPLNHAPTLIVPAESTMVVGAQLAPLDGVLAHDVEDGDLTDAVLVEYPAGWDVTVPGTYTLTYSVTDSKGARTVRTRTVMVQPVPSVPAMPVNRAPQLTVPGDVTIPFGGGGFNVFTGASAVDPEDGVLQVEVNGSMSLEDAGSYTLSYWAQDSAGARVMKTRVVTVAPNLPPVITGTTPVTIPLGDLFDPAIGVSASDPEGGDVLLASPAAFTPTEAGPVVLTYRVTDQWGLETTVERTVTVTSATVDTPSLLTHAEAMAYIESRLIAKNLTRADAVLSTSNTAAWAEGNLYSRDKIDARVNPISFMPGSVTHFALEEQPTHIVVRLGVSVDSDIPGGA